MYKVYIINKKTGQQVEVLERGLTERQAESFCESWGWNYCDENGVNFWIEYDVEN